MDLRAYGYNVTGSMRARFTNGALSAPKTEPDVITSSTSIQCAAYSEITLKNGNTVSDEVYGEHSASLVLKAGFFDSPQSTLHYAFANDGIDVAAGEYRGTAN